MAVTYNWLEDIPRIFFYNSAAVTYTQRTGAIMDYFPDTVQVGDILYFGFTPLFGHPNTIRINVGTLLVADAITVVWERYFGSYSTYAPASWSAIAGLRDNSNTFRRSGERYIAWNPDNVRNWTYLYANIAAFPPSTGISLKWIRCRITAVTNLTEGGANQTFFPQFHTLRLRATETFTLDTIWTADKAGTYTLMYPEPAAANLNLYWQPRVQEWGATRLSIVITDFTASGVVTLTGTDVRDVAITEDISITANGTYTTTRAFKTISTDGIDCTGTYTIEIKQPRWGVCGKFGNVWQLDWTYLDVGDGTTATSWSQSLGHLRLFYSGFRTLAAVTTTLGVKDATYGFPDRAFIISFFNSGSPGADGGWLNSHIHFTNGIAKLYNVTYYNEGTADPTGRIHFESAITELDIIRLTAYGTYYLLLLEPTSYKDIQSNLYYCVNVAATPYLFEDLKAYGTGISGGFLISPNATTYATAAKIVRLDHKGAGAAVSLYSPGVVVMIDPVFTPVPSQLSARLASVGSWYRIWLYYSFNVKTIDKDKNPISGATITVWNKNGEVQFTATTGADGTITEQKVKAKAWERTGTGAGYTYYAAEHEINYNDFIIEVKRAGYQTYKSKFTLDRKIDWQLRLKSRVDVIFKRWESRVEVK